MVSTATILLCLIFCNLFSWRRLQHSVLIDSASLVGTSVVKQFSFLISIFLHIPLGSDSSSWNEVVFRCSASLCNSEYLAALQGAFGKTTLVKLIDGCLLLMSVHTFLHCVSWGRMHYRRSISGKELCGSSDAVQVTLTYRDAQTRVMGFTHLALAYQIFFVVTIYIG